MVAAPVTTTPYKQSPPKPTPTPPPPGPSVLQPPAPPNPLSTAPPGTDPTQQPLQQNLTDVLQGLMAPFESQIAALQSQFQSLEPVEAQLQDVSRQQLGLSQSQQQQALGEQKGLLGIEQGALNRQGPLQGLLESLRQQSMDITQGSIDNQYNQALAGLLESPGAYSGGLNVQTPIGKTAAVAGTPATPGTPARYQTGPWGTGRMIPATPGKPGTPGTPSTAIMSRSPLQELAFKRDEANQRLSIQSQQDTAQYNELKSSLGDRQAKLNLTQQKLGFDTALLPQEFQLAITSMNDSQFLQFQSELNSALSSIASPLSSLGNVFGSVLGALPQSMFGGQ